MMILKVFFTSIYDSLAGNSAICLLLIITSPVFAQQDRGNRDDIFTLENKDIKISLSKNAPVVYEYLKKSNGAGITGSSSASGPEITFFKGAGPVMSRLTGAQYTGTQTGNSIKYHVLSSFKNDPAVEFDLIYSLSGNDLVIEFNNVIEHGDFRLISIQLPALLTVRAENSPAALALPAGSGRLINVATASTGSYEYDINWLNSILAGIAYNSECLGVLDTRSIENHTIASVSDRNGIKYGSLSMKLIHRLHNYDLTEFGHLLPVTDPEYLLKVQDSSKVTVSITDDYDKDGVISWVDGTKLIRDRIEFKSNQWYADKSVIKWFLDWPYSRRFTTFSEVLESVRAFANQAGSPNRIIYIVGWQYIGHDSGYPSVDKVNERLGGYKELERLVTEAKKFNVIISFHDNYDDVYMGNPGWDPDVIARDPQGNLMKGGAWDGGQSYLVSNYKYAKKSALQRVRNTLERYPFIKETYHIDVLAGGYNNGRKYDFNPKSPAGAEKNFEGKKMIIEEFNKHKIDITTEDFTGFFVGHVGFFLKILDQDNVVYRNEEKIPMIPFIYHSKTNYGMRMSGDKGFLQRMIYGENMGATSATEYILDALPRHLLYGKAMELFDKDGESERVTYDDGSYVQVDYATLKYTVSLKGQVIAKDFTSFVPVNDSTYFACSRYGGKLSYAVPGKWIGNDNIKVYRMNADGSKEELTRRLTDGNIEVYTEPNVVYKAVYTK